MNEIIFDRKEYKTYKDFYHDIAIKLDNERFLDWQNEYEDFCYDGNLLYEFLWYCKKDDSKYVFKNFDRKKIKEQKKYEDFEYNIILSSFEDFVKEYPNNSMEYRNDQEK